MKILPKISESCVAKLNSNVYVLKNTNSHHILLNTTIIPLYNGNVLSPSNKNSMWITRELIKLIFCSIITIFCWKLNVIIDQVLYFTCCVVDLPD